MKLTLSVLLLAAAPCALSCNSKSNDGAQTQNRFEDEAAIRSIALQRIESFNGHQPPRSGAFTDDADFVNVYGMWRKGPSEIESRQQERMQTVLREAKITLRDLRIRFIRPDVAVVHELHEMSGMLNADGQKMPPHEELGIRVFVKEEGKWLITAFHNTIVRSDGPRPAPE